MVEQDLATFIGERQSIRRYRPGRIDRTVVLRLMEAAARAPSAHNRQPWRFAVLDNFAGKHNLATAMGARLREDRQGDGDSAQAIESDLARSYARITEAPVVIVVCVDTRDMDGYPDSRRAEAEHLMAVQSTAMAAQNLLLAAESEGLGACVMCAPLFCPDTVTRVLNLPPEWTPQMLLTIGKPATAGKNRERLPLDKIVRWTDDSGC
ncbi:MAG TPA: nitroreductase family protein [Pseudolabrys sp.]|nr:nitroreductase family protein [Pseudolabrys sp.]